MSLQFLSYRLCGQAAGNCSRAVLPPKPFASVYRNTLQIACPILLGAAPNMPQKSRVVTRKDIGLGGCTARVPICPLCVPKLFCFNSPSTFSSKPSQICLRHPICPYLLNISPIYPSGTLSSNSQPCTISEFPLAMVLPGSHCSFTKPSAKCLATSFPNDRQLDVFYHMFHRLTFYVLLAEAHVGFWAYSGSRMSAR